MDLYARDSERLNMNPKAMALQTTLVRSVLSILLPGCEKEYGAPYVQQGSLEGRGATFSASESAPLPAQNWGGSSAPAEAGDLQYYVDEQGHKVSKTYYVVYCDIFYK